MSQQQQTPTASQSWPISALVALGSLIVAALVFVWVLNQQKHILTDVQTAAYNSQQAQMEMQQQLIALAEKLHQDRRQELGFMVKQQTYSELMGLLSDIYIHTQRLDTTALEEVHHRVQQVFYSMEPFLSGPDRQWMLQQLEAITKLSGKLAEPLNEYEENLLASKTQLRQLIDETHQKLYPMLFGAKETLNDSTSQADK